MAESTQAATKEQWEQKVFLGFARKSGLNVSIASIRSCKPNLPDIACDIDGTTYFFELAEVVPEEQAKALSVEKRYTVGTGELKGHSAMLRILKQKQHKTYEDASPIDLLLYFNKDFSMYLSDVPTGQEKSDIDAAAEECTQSGPFSRVWTYCTWTDQVKRLA